MTQDDIHRILDKAASEMGMTLDVADAKRGMYVLTHPAGVVERLFIPETAKPQMRAVLLKMAVRGIFDKLAEAAFNKVTVFEAK